MPLDPTLQSLLDRLAIRDLRYQYAQGLDRRDFDRAVACYAPDAHFQMPDSEFHGRDAIRQTVTGLARYNTTMHFMGNHLAEINADRATSETYCTAYHFYDRDGAEQQYVMGMRYLDQLVRTPDGWQIVDTFAHIDWLRGQSLLYPNRKGG
jgi:ketosteroid isomerase-like protein